MLQNEKRMLQMHGKDSTSLLGERDKEIITRSMLGVFHERFSPKEFEDQFREIRNVFEGSNILSGVQPYLLYFNLPKSIIQHMHRPERLVLKPAAQATAVTDPDSEPPGSSGPKSFPTIREVIEYFDQRIAETAMEADDESFNQKVFEREHMANIVLFEVEVGGRTCVIGGFTTNGWVTMLSAEENNSEHGSFEESNQE